LLLCIMRLRAHNVVDSIPDNIAWLPGNSSTYATTFTTAYTSSPRNKKGDSIAGAPQTPRG
jgi:hypothetical protein